MSTSTAKRISINQSSRQRSAESSIAKARALFTAQHSTCGGPYQLTFDSVDFNQEGVVSAVLDLLHDYPLPAASSVVIKNYHYSGGSIHRILHAFFVPASGVSRLTVVSLTHGDREYDTRQWLKVIGMGLKSSTSCLQYLHLQLRYLSDEGGYTLKEAIADSKSLKTLSFHGTRIERNAVYVLSEALLGNTSLESVTFAASQLEDCEFAVLVRGIKDHPTIKKFGVDMAACKAQTLVALASALESPKCQIEELDLRPSTNRRSASHQNHQHTTGSDGNNNNDNDGEASSNTRGNQEEEAFQTLIRSIGGNISLSSLTVAERPLSNESLTNLGTALTQNSTLRFLDMSHCQISDTGLSHFATCLPRMKGLRKLWIGGRQQFGRDSVRKLVLEGLRDNMEIVDLILPNQEQSYFYKRFAYYTSLNAAGRRLVQLDSPLHAALWPLVLERANKFVRFTSQDKTRVYTSKEDLLYYMIRNGLVIAGL